MFPFLVRHRQRDLAFFLILVPVNGNPHTEKVIELDHIVHRDVGRLWETPRGWGPPEAVRRWIVPMFMSQQVCSSTVPSVPG